MEDFSVGKMILAGVGVIVAFVLVGFLVWGASVALAPVFGKGEAYKKTESADYRIANYDKFHDDCNNVVARKQIVANLEEQLALDKKAGADYDTLSRDRTNLIANKNVLVELVNQYNADASKTATRAKFRASDLPYHIDVDGETTCGS